MKHERRDVGHRRDQDRADGDGDSAGRWTKQKQLVVSRSAARPHRQRRGAFPAIFTILTISTHRVRSFYLRIAHGGGSLMDRQLLVRIPLTTLPGVVRSGSA